MSGVAADPYLLSPPWTSFRSGSSWWQMHTEFAAPTVIERLRSPEALMSAPAQRLRPDDRPRTTFLVRTTWPEFPNTPLVIKRYRPENFWEACREWFRPSRARRAFECSLELMRLNIRTARPVAVGEVRCYGWLRESYLITELVPNASTLRQMWANSQTGRDRRAMVSALAVLMARLHNAGLAHTDPSLSNFLVQRGEDGTLRLVLIDLDGVRRRSRRSLPEAAQDLRIVVRRIPVSPRERLWLAAQYCRARSHRPSARQLIALLRQKA